MALDKLCKEDEVVSLDDEVSRKEEVGAPHGKSKCPPKYHLPSHMNLGRYPPFPSAVHCICIPLVSK